MNLTTSEAARIAGVTSRTIRRWIDRGDLLNVGSQARVLVDMDALTRFCDPYAALTRRVAGRT